jgi:hypothetical protein
MILPGPNLRTLREKLGLTMGDVETASGRLARKYNNEEYLITTSRLSDFETKRVSRAFTASTRWQSSTVVNLAKC